MASCPACHGTNTRKLSILYEEGISTVDLSSTTKTVGAGVSSAGLGVGIAKSQGATTGIQQTELSKRATPPPFSPIRLPPEPQLATPRSANDPGDSAMNVGFILGLSSLVVWYFWAPLYAFIALVAGSLIYGFGNLRKKNMTETERETSRTNQALYEQKRQQLERDYDEQRAQWKLDCEKAKKNYELKNPLEIWKRSYMCMACGHQFDPSK